MKELLERLLRGARDLKYYIDIQPPDKPVRNFDGRPANAMPGYQLAAQAIADAEILLADVRAEDRPEHPENPDRAQKFNSDRIAAQITDDHIDRFFTLADRASTALAVLACAAALGWIIIPTIIRIVGRS
jgi:hypothetical protein